MNDQHNGSTNGARADVNKLLLNTGVIASTLLLALSMFILHGISDGMAVLRDDVNELRKMVSDQQATVAAQGELVKTLKERVSFVDELCNRRSEQLDALIKEFPSYIVPQRDPSDAIRFPTYRGFQQ